MRWKVPRESPEKDAVFWDEASEEHPMAEAWTLPLNWVSQNRLLSTVVSETNMKTHENVSSSYEVLNFDRPSVPVLENGADVGTELPFGGFYFLHWRATKKNFFLTESQLYWNR